MELSLHQKMLAEYELTSKQMAEALGISTNALRCRLKRGNSDELEFRIVEGKKLFKRLRGNQGDKTTSSIRPPGRWNSQNKKKKEPRRGVTHIGEAKYPNEAFRKHNELKILNRISKEVPQYVLNKINPRLLSMAQEQHKEDLEKASGKFTEPKYYGGLNKNNNNRYTNSYLRDTEVNTGFNPLKNYDYYNATSETKEDTRPTEYIIPREPRVREPGSDYKPGKFKHLDDAISKAKKKF